MVLKTVEGALPVFEMRRDSDAERDHLDESVVEHVEDDVNGPSRESDAAEIPAPLEEPGDEDEFDDVGTAEQIAQQSPAPTPLPASLASMPLPASPSIIAIRHKGSRTMKRGDSEILTNPVSNLSSELAAASIEDSESGTGGDDGSGNGTPTGKKKTKRKGTNSDAGIITPISTDSAPASPTISVKRSSSSSKKKRGSASSDAGAGAGAALPAELPSSPTSARSNGSSSHDDVALPPPLSLPPLPTPSSTGPISPSNHSSSPKRIPLSRSASALPPGASLPPTPPPMPFHLASSSSGEPPRSLSDAGDDDDAPPPMIGALSFTEEIANISFQRRTSSLAVDGFSTLRDSFDGSDPSSPGSGTDGKRQRLRRRQSSKTNNAANIVRKRNSVVGAGDTGSAGASPSPSDRKRTQGSTRPRMMDGAIRIVKSMYEPDVRAAMDSRIFAIEAKEYPENVVYVDEDEEATEDYNVEFPAIKAAVIEKLILGLTPETYADTDFNFTFLLSFPSFMTPQRLCELLKVRWTIPLPQKPSKTGVTVDAETFQKRKLTPIRLRIINVVKLWLDEHRQALDNDSRAAIEKFITEVIKPDMAGPAGTLLKLLKESTESKDEQIMFDDKPPKPYLPMNLKTKLSILDVHPEEIARQITLIDSALYRKIKPAEFLNSGWTKADKEIKSPGIHAMISTFNVISRWVSTQILLQPDLKQRAITLNRIICIAQHCYEYNNFNGVMEIIASLHNSSIHRLYNTWELLPQKSWDMFEFLSTLMNSNAGEGNFYLYRNALRKVVPPLVPYLGVYLTDLIFLNDGNKDFVDEGKKMVNFHKMAKIARVVRTIVTHQQAPYCLAPVEFIQDFLLKGQLFTDDEQYTESCKLEKKVPKSQRQQATAKPVKKIKVDFKALNINDD